MGLSAEQRDGRAAEPFASRLKQVVRDPTALAGPPTVLAFCGLRYAGMIAPLPYWSIVVLVVSAQAVSLLATAAMPARPRASHAAVYVGVVMGVIAVVAFATGWGPVLPMGFLFGAAYCLDLLGSRAARPVTIGAIACVGLGMGAVALGVAPSLIPAPRVDGLAVLGLLGVILTVGLLRRFTADRERVETELRSSERWFRALVHNASDIIIVTGSDGRPTYVSPAFERRLGIPIHELTERPAADLVHPEDLARLYEHASATLGARDRPWITEVRLRDSRSGWRWFEATITTHFDDPDINGIVANLHDITDRRAAEEALREAHERFQAAYQNAPIGFALIELDGTIMDVNPSFAAIVDRDSASLIGLSVTEFTHPDDQGISADVMRRLAEGETTCRFEKRYFRPDGTEVWTRVSASCVRDEEGRPRHLVSLVEDITESRSLREHLTFVAFHDQLTGLPNRALFVDRLATGLKRTLRNGRKVAVLLADIDQFKLVNDTLGLEVGDELIVAIAERLQQAVRPADTVARLAGGEFVVLCDGIRDEAEALDIAARVSGCLDLPVQVQGSEFFVTSCIGIALGKQADLPERVLRDAGSALRRAKEQGSSRIEVFDQRDDVWTRNRLTTTNDLHLALRRQEFEVHYQPFVDLHTDSVVAVEALVRWRHPVRGLLPPAEFVDLAEEVGLIAPLGAWVLKEACGQMASWRHGSAVLGGEPWRHTVSVNVSPRQLMDARFAALVADTLAETAMDPDGLWLEITESTLLRDPEQAIATLTALRDTGVHISIDDFGTGYSSLSYLERLPAESLKIDRSFIVGLGRGVESSAIVRAIVGLADSLGMACIAEGIETEEQLDRVRGLGCHLAQGYLLGMPQAAPDLDMDAVGRIVRPVAGAPHALPASRRSG
ncbi:MAG TPA: EAL domain-containing protein [Acidimicrobiales bacterium]|nr:EAL domain-containing protein [Acidimicrobiales bacterium]